ncbi:MAG: pantoate--beta-alanine ligase [Bacteroidales bacterium]|nr:pantoate--beta-alanine ligase [Bacteroidales bacterium]
MKIIEHIDLMKKQTASARNKGRIIGLVPTMGALHEGHLSLIDAASKNDQFIAVSIFVNPAQFNDPKDLESYPKDLETDLEMLKKYPVDVVFNPPVEEMYPEPDERVFDLDPLDKVMEGKYRPGHFNGVAQIVSKLFEAVRPDRAYFGKKDLQQLAIIKKLVAQMNQDIQIVDCPIIREPDGLAMSSRNQLLTFEERKAAPFIYKTLKEAAGMKSGHSPREIEKYVSDRIRKHPLMELNYFEIVDDVHLTRQEDWDKTVNTVGCIAVKLGRVRLIDNINFD